VRTLATFSLLTMLWLVPAMGTERTAGVTAEDFVKVCPLEIRGTIAAATLTPDGVAVEFRTSVPTAMAPVRDRAAKLAALLNQVATQNARPQDRVVPFTATYQETETGASLILKPMQAADLRALQQTMVDAVRSMNFTMRCQLAAGN